MNCVLCSIGAKRKPRSSAGNLRANVTIQKMSIVNSIPAETGFMRHGLCLHSLIVCLKFSNMASQIFSSEDVRFECFVCVVARRRIFSSVVAAKCAVLRKLMPNDKRNGWGTLGQLSERRLWINAWRTSNVDEEQCNGLSTFGAVVARNGGGLNQNCPLTRIGS